MTNSRILSMILLGTGALCIIAGMFLLAGLGAALVTVGVLLVAADWLVPGR